MSKSDKHHFCCGKPDVGIFTAVPSPDLSFSLYNPVCILPALLKLLFVPRVSVKERI
jgi:hypothetical protein